MRLETVFVCCIQGSQGVFIALEITAQGLAKSIGELLSASAFIVGFLFGVSSCLIYQAA